MGYNPNVGYQRGNYGLQTLVAERIAKWGKPARYSEYVTGYKSPLNFSGHNADSNGIAHAVDIFVGPGNLTHAQGQELFEAVRQEGLEGLVLGNPKRATYVIFNRQIAGDKTGWKAFYYDGPDPHTDHVHVSSIDLLYGDTLPAWYGPADYDDTSTWNLGGTVAAPQSGAITPIQEDDMSAEDVKNIRGDLNTVHEAVRAAETATAASIAEAERRIRGDIATVHNTIIRDVGGQLAGSREAMSQLAAGKSVDFQEVEAAAKRGAEAAIAEGVVQVDVNFTGAAK